MPDTDIYEKENNILSKIVKDYSSLQNLVVQISDDS